MPNDRCCNSDAQCGSGKCRVCVGCFLYPWDCCDRGGSACLALNAECQGAECLAQAFCLCAGGLSCGGDLVPAHPASLFTDACDELRLEESLAPSGTPVGRPELVATKGRVKRARRMIKKAAKSTRKMINRGAVSKVCGKAVLARLKTVKQAIPRGRRLRQCVLAR
jgi:hypothetical protein